MSLQYLTSELNTFITIIQQNANVFVQIIGAIWIFNIINWLLGSKLNYFGVHPRKHVGLLGIFFGNFLHKNPSHLFFNTIPLVALGLFMLSFGFDVFINSSISIIIIEGFLVWIFARPGIHIGASSLICGYFSFLLIAAYYHPGASSILIASITIYYFGSIFFGIFPSEAKTSWEAHLFGFLAGIITYYFQPYFLILK